MAPDSITGGVFRTVEPQGGPVTTDSKCLMSKSRRIFGFSEDAFEHPTFSYGTGKTDTFPLPSTKDIRRYGEFDDLTIITLGKERLELTLAQNLASPT